MNVFDLFAKIGLDTSEYDAGLDGALTKGKSFASKLGSGLASAAKIGTAALAAIGGASLAATGALLKGAASVAEYGDTIDKMSQKMGMSAEAYQEWDAVMQHSGTSMEAMKASMKTLANAAETGSDAFERLGISQEQIANMSQEQLFEATITALQNVGDETERTYLAGKTLGRGATELGALLNTSAEETQAMRDRVHELGGVMSDDAVKASAKFQDNMQDLTTAISGAKRGIMSDLLPSLNLLTEGLTKLITGEEGADEAISQGVDLFLESVENGIDRVVSIGETLLPKLAETIVKHAPKMLKAGFTAITSLASGVIKNLPEMLKTGASMLAEMVTGFAQALPEAIPEALNTIFDLINAFTDPEVLTSLINAAIQLVVGLTEGIINAIPVLIERLPEILMNIGQALIDSAPVLLDAIMQINEMIGNAVMEYGPKLLSWLLQKGGEFLSWLGEVGSNAINAVVTWLSELPEKMAYWAGYAVGKFIEFIVTLPDKAKEIFTNFIEKVTEFGKHLKEEGPEIANKFKDDLIDLISSLPDKFKEIGGNIVDGLWNGIKNGWEWLTNKVSELAKSLLQGTKDALGIKSPSKEFAWVGKMVDEGFAKGIADNESVISDQMRRTFDFSDTTASVKSSASQLSTSNVSLDSVVRILSEILDKIPDDGSTGSINTIIRGIQRQDRIRYKATGSGVFV